MGITVANLLDEQDWVALSLDQQSYPSYLWADGGLLADAPIDFAATFDGAMWMSRKPIEIPAFNRNPLRVRPGFVVPRHHHNFDEMLLVFEGEYSIEYDEDDGTTATVLVRPGEVFVSHAGTPYTMTAGPDGVVYIETWPGPIRQLTTTWHDSGWVRR